MKKLFLLLPFVLLFSCKKDDVGIDEEWTFPGSETLEILLGEPLEKTDFYLRLDNRTDYTPYASLSEHTFHGGLIDYSKGYFELYTDGSLKINTTIFEKSDRYRLSSYKDEDSSFNELLFPFNIDYTSSSKTISNFTLNHKGINQIIPTVSNFTPKKDEDIIITWNEPTIKGQKVIIEVWLGDNAKQFIIDDNGKFILPSVVVKELAKDNETSSLDITIERANKAMQNIGDKKITVINHSISYILLFLQD